MARISEHAERYDEMVPLVREIAQMNGVLSSEERNLLSIAYKNVIGPRRASWRVVERGDMSYASVQALRKKVEKEMDDICNDIVDLLNTQLIPNSNNDETSVFFYKMLGDYHRYRAEYQTEEVRQSAVNEALKAYEAAEKAATSLSSTNPIRLGLALNFSVFYYEISSDQGKACQLAKDAFDSAIAEIDSLEEDNYRDSTLILQLLRDNLTLWSTDRKEEAEPAEEEA